MLYLQTVAFAEQTEMITFDDKKPSLKCDISIVTIENIMQLMGHAGLSGEIQISTPDNHAVFIIRDGILIFGYLQHSLPRIGERLVKEGYITNTILRECLAFYREKQSKLRFGEILLARNYISINTLEEIIKQQVKECFFEVLKWAEGTFAFYDNDTPTNEEFSLAERIDHLIIEGIVAMDSKYA